MTTISRTARAAALLAALAVTGAATASAALPAEAAVAGKPRTFANCTAMHKVYPHGVGRKGAQDKVKGSSKKVTSFRVDTALYQANAKSDRDHDGIACEAA